MFRGMIKADGAVHKDIKCKCDVYSNAVSVYIKRCNDTDEAAEAQAYIQPPCWFNIHALQLTQCLTRVGD